MSKISRIKLLAITLIVLATVHPVAATEITVMFQEGDINNYSGTVDTYLDSNDPNPQGSNIRVRALDDTNIEVEQHGLLRFDNILGRVQFRLAP